MRRVFAFLLALLLVFSAAETVLAAAETAPVVLEPTVQRVQLDLKLYNTLMKRLNAQLKKKDFSALSKKFLREVLDYEAQYYAQWRTVYRDLPAFEDYVQENLIEVIPKIGKLRLYDITTEEGEKKKSTVEWTGQTTTSESKSSVTVLYTHPLKADGNEHQSDIGVLAHELRHVRDRAAIWETFFPTKTMEDIFVEGGASFHERYVFPMQTTENYRKDITADNGMKMTFTREQMQSYPYYQTFFDSLVYLAGYHIVDAVGEGKDPFAVKRAIAKRYNQKTADALWSLLKKLPEENKLSSGQEQTFRTSLKFFRLLLACVKTDISRLKTKQPQTVRAYMDVYRNLKLKILPAVTDKKGKDITAKVFSTAALDRLLAKKVVASRALGTLYKDKALSVQAVTEMLYFSSDEYKTQTVFPCHLPPTISVVQYTFSAKDGKGVMKMEYADEDGWNVVFSCVFNAERTLKRAAKYQFT